MTDVGFVFGIMIGSGVVGIAIYTVADELKAWREAWLEPYDGDCLEEEEDDGA